MRQTLTLLLLAAASVVALLLYNNVQESRLFRLSTIPTPQPTAASAPAAISLTTVSTTNLLQKPRFTGQDAQNRSWEITADQATQHGSSTSTTLHLTTISATLNLPTQNGQHKTQPITLTAHQAEYTQATDSLILTQNVILQGQGLTLTAPQMSANLNQRTLKATGGVRATLQFKQNKAQ